MCKSGVEWPIGIGPPTKFEIPVALEAFIASKEVLVRRRKALRRCPAGAKDVQRGGRLR
jgi:hypothetical protein